MQSTKIVTVEEMKRIEQLAICEGGCEELFIQNAGIAISQIIQEWIQNHPLFQTVILLVGKGHNGADALAAGIDLLSHGFVVKAYLLFSIEECRLECQKRIKRFAELGGETIDPDHFSFSKDQVILDGIFGIGIQGPMPDRIQSIILKANQSHAPIFAIDIPSGLHGTSGKIEEAAILATATIAMGFPKIGYFLEHGWNCVGIIHTVPFGLSNSVIEKAKAVAFMPNWVIEKETFPLLPRNRHKYQSGMVVGFAGSNPYSGAAKLAALSALRAGAGIVHLYYPSNAKQQMVTMPFEIIHQPISQKQWNQSLEKSKSVFIGPGLIPTSDLLRWLKSTLAKMHQPLVIDAGALSPSLTYPPGTILTPHRGEAARFFQTRTESSLFSACQQYCHERKTVIALKGAPTWIFSPNEPPEIITRGDSGMAKAGSGDVLTGIIAALLAQGCAPVHAARLGALFHGVAGECAAEKVSSRSIIASDLMAYFAAAMIKNS